MEIQFTKKQDKKHTISCRRTDGTVTWMQADDFFIYHDLMHYAVETTLHYKNAFYGMLAGGTNITDFELPKEIRPFQITPEAFNAECIVNLALVEFMQGRADDFNKVLKDSYDKSEFNIEAPELDQAAIEQVHASFASLVLQWNALPFGESLNVSFSE